MSRAPQEKPDFLEERYENNFAKFAWVAWAALSSAGVVLGENGSSLCCHRAP